MKEEPQSDGNVELSAVIGALLDTLNDKSEDVRKSVMESVDRISRKDPETVIRTTIYFWELHKKISVEHMEFLLRVLSNSCKHSSTNLSADLASSVSEIAVNELIGEIENEAAGLLIELSKTHCIQAMGGLLTKLEPGIFPHHAVVYTIGKIASANPHGMLYFFKLVLTIVLPMLNQMRDELLKQAICFTIGKFCETINEYLTNTDNVPPEINRHTYKEEIRSTFDILMNNWLKMSRDLKSTAAILSSLIHMLPLLPGELDNERIVKLIPMCLNLCKKPTIRLPAIRVLATILNCASEIEKESLRPFIEHIHQTLSEFISTCPFNENREALLTHYEVLQCSKSLVILYPEEGLDRILQQLKSPIGGQHARALVVLKHLINTLPPEDDATLHRIALSLQESLGESGALQTVGAIVALAARPTFPLLPSQRATFVHYMVCHCTPKSDEAEAYSEALYLLATTVDGAESWLWPCLIRALLDPSCAESATSVLRALSPLATKMMRNESLPITERDFPGTKVLGRCLELLSCPANQLAVVIFLKAAAPLLGHQVKSHWDNALSELLYFLQNEQKDGNSFTQRDLIWEGKVVEWLEESVKVEGESWGAKLADELALKSNIAGVAPLLASMCNSNAHITLLIELARSHGTTKEFARAVGICAKRHLNVVLKSMEEFCSIEDARKVPVKLLGLVRDAKAAATAEAAKAGLLQSYAEIAQRGDPQTLFPAFEKHVLPWTVRQLNECKELSTREAGLAVLEQVANAVHPIRWPETKGLRIKASALATLLAILQSSAGYRPLQLYPAVLKAAIALIRVPPLLNNEEREIFLSAMLDKMISASSEILLLLHPEILQRVVDELGTLSSEIVLDSADALADLVDILLPWMQSKSNIERKITMLVLHTVLRSYYNSIKYTYPDGKLDAGKLVGRIFAWCADVEVSLRTLIVDCVVLSLNIASRHRSIMPDGTLDETIKQIKQDITSNESPIFFEAVKTLARTISERIPSGEIISLSEGLIEGLLYRGEAGLVAGTALAQHFQIRGAAISRTDVYLIGSIIMQMRQIENASCRHSAAVAVVSLMRHHPEEAIEHLLAQPLPLDRGTELCWKEIGKSGDLGKRALKLLLIKLEANNLFAENTTALHPGKSNTASFPSLAAIIALKHLLRATNEESLLGGAQLPELLSVLLKYLAGWLNVDAPASLVNTKFGYVPNREACKIYPHAEVYSVLANVLTVIDSNVSSSLLKDTTTSSEVQAEENVMLTVRTLIRCISMRNDVLSNVAQSLGKLVTSTIAMQRAVAVAFYAELIGKVDCGAIWLDAIINTLHEAKTDSSQLVRKLATVGLARIAYLEPSQVDEYFDNCLDALLDGLVEPANGDGGGEVVLESLRGLSVLLRAQVKKPISPRVVLALKPFVEKESWELKLAAISAIGAIATNWRISVASPDDDLTDHLLGCLPCLVIRLEDTNATVAKTAQETLCKAADIFQCEKLAHVISSNLGPRAEFNFEIFSRALINCLKVELPQRAEDLRNAVARGYSKSENHHIRATSALLLGLFDSPRPEDIQRLLQLLRDKESIVRVRTSYALSFCFTL